MGRRRLQSISGFEFAESSHYAEIAELRIDIEAAVKSLPPPLRKLLRLWRTRSGDLRTQVEMAAISSRSSATICRALMQLKSELRQRLHEQWCPSTAVYSIPKNKARNVVR
jgi:DNA-directed RNA polymerase specialized sigma24 family protein